MPCLINEKLGKAAQNPPGTRAGVSSGRYVRSRPVRVPIQIVASTVIIALLVGMSGTTLAEIPTT